MMCTCNNTSLLLLCKTNFLLIIINYDLVKTDDVQISCNCFLPTVLQRLLYNVTIYVLKGT